MLLAMTSASLYPFTFHPLYMERVWGGHALEELYGKSLPPAASIGESWEISDRPEAVSVIANGSLAGRDLRWLMERSPQDLLGARSTSAQRFPLLVKLLDARDVLSVQAHPSPASAAQSGGAPKTELWYIARAGPMASLFVGLRSNVTREMFEESLRRGTVQEALHRLPVRAGDVMFIPSGRVHALGGGLVIIEIQQNSDTTYRVFDWNRMGLDGRPRALHIPESMASIAFDDFEPSLVTTPWEAAELGRSRCLARDPAFHVEQWEIPPRGRVRWEFGVAQVVCVVRGRVSVDHTLQPLVLHAGEFCLLPAALAECTLEAGEQPAELLRAQVF